jgi:predicted metalloprotease
MRWKDQRQSDHVEDRRGQGVAMRRGGMEGRQLSDCDTFARTEP